MPATKKTAANTATRGIESLPNHARSFLFLQALEHFSNAVKNLSYFNPLELGLAPKAFDGYHRRSKFRVTWDGRVVAGVAKVGGTAEEH